MEVGRPETWITSLREAPSGRRVGGPEGGHWAGGAEGGPQGEGHPRHPEIVLFQLHHILILKFFSCAHTAQATVQRSGLEGQLQDGIGYKTQDVLTTRQAFPLNGVPHLRRVLF